MTTIPIRGEIDLPWRTFTPTWEVLSGGNNVTVGNGSLVGRYTRLGKLIFYTIEAQFGSTTAGGTSWPGGGSWSGLQYFGLPFPARAGRFSAGRVQFQYQSLVRFYDVVILDADMNRTYLLDASGAGIAHNSPQNPVSGDRITIRGQYEAA